jgi:LytS/YehU family sensor histidine kinase
LNFSHFCLDSCIANKVEKFELEMASWMQLEGFQVVLSHFWGLVCTGLTGWSAGPVHMLHTGLTSGVDRSDQSGLSCCSCPISSGVLHAFIQGELHWFRGSSLWFSSFGLVVCAL